MRSLILLFLVSIFSWGVLAQETILREDEIALKSAYLINIIRFVSWTDGQLIVQLCVSDKSDIYSYIESSSKIDLGDGRELELVAAPGSISECDAIYVDANSELTFSVESALPDPNVLAITDMPRSIGKGYALQFFLRDLKLRFTIDEDLVSNSNFKISSKLMNLSRRLD